MSPRGRHRQRPGVELEQLWYGWSQENLDGSRGYGVVAASPGWKTLLESGSDALGPAVAVPDIHDGRTPPASGGFVLVRGMPVVARRIPLGSDDLARPGSYGVRLVIAPDADLDALAATQLLTDGVLDDPPPPGGQRDLDPLTWTTAGPEASRPAVDHGDLVPLMAAVLQGLADDRQVSVRVADESVAVRLLMNAFARLPRPWLINHSFSTFETGSASPSLRVVFRLNGWDSSDGARPTNSSVLEVDLTSRGAADGLQPTMIRWAGSLIERDESPWRPGAEPSDVAALGALLDSVDRARVAPHALSADDIVTLGGSTALATWAAGSGAHHSAVRALREVAPERLGDLQAAVELEAAASSVMTDAAWECVEADAEGSVGVANAESVLTRQGVSQAAIDLARVRHLPARTADSASFDAATSQRVLRVLLGQPGGLTSDDWPILARVTWDAALRSTYPTAWLQAVLRDAAYRGPAMTDAEASALPSGALTTAMQSAVDDGADPEVVGARLARVLPPGRSPRVQVLVTASRVPGIGMSAVFLGALATSQATDADRAALLSQRWAHFVDEAALPGYLATSLVPRRVHAGPSLTRRGMVVLAATVLVVVVARCRSRPHAGQLTRPDPRWRPPRTVKHPATPLSCVRGVPESGV